MDKTPSLMEKNNCYWLGYVDAPVGIRGELALNCDADDLGRYKDLPQVFFEQDGVLIPFAVSSARPKGSKQLIVALEGIDAPTDAQAFSGCQVYVPLSFLPPLSGNKFYYHEVIGFDVIDVHFGPVGKILRFIEGSMQTVMAVQHPNAEVLIPLVDDFVVSVDRIRKIMEIKAPEGLIELYLKPGSEEEE
jgi:16S rRNA processing protein RimM